MTSDPLLITAKVLLVIVALLIISEAAVQFNRWAWGG